MVLLGKLALVLAVVLALLNAGFVLASWCNRLRGCGRYYSTVPLVSALLVLLVARPLWPEVALGWLVLVPLLDAGNWALARGLWLWFTGAVAREEAEETPAASRRRSDR